MSLFKKTVHHSTDIEPIMLLQGKILVELNRSKSSTNIQDFEFKVTSQNGEDGIIQHLIQKVAINNPVFIEFGVESYREANTRFLLQNNNWSGLIIDGNKKDMAHVKNSTLGWKFDLQAVGQFITKENINDIITTAGIQGEIGILSVDIDGNDYWVWDAIQCVNPQIVIAEYNSLFGKKAKISVPYDDAFYRTDKHFSNLYFGASLAALEYLANKKGYSLVGSNSFGCNAFFVRNDCLGTLQAMSASDAYVKSKFKESRNKDGKLSYLNHAEGLKLLADMPVIDVVTGKLLTIKDIQ